MGATVTRKTACLAILLFGVTLTSTTAGSERMAAGVAARVEGDTARAIELLEDAHETQQHNPDLVLQLALAYRADGQLKRSARLIESALEDHPQHADLRVEQARLAIWDGRSDHARQQLDTLLAEVPNHGEALALRARLALQKGELAQADADLARLRALGDERAGTQLLIADLAWLRGDGAGARTAVDAIWEKHQGESGLREACCDRSRRYRRTSVEVAAGQGWLSDTPLGNWQQQRLQINHRWNTRQDWWLRGERYHRFDEHDLQLTLGSARQLSPAGWAWVEIGTTTDAAFRPDRQASFGGEWAPGGTLDAVGDVTLIGRLQASDYRIGTVISADLGGRYWWTDRSAVTLQANLTRDENRDYNAGWRIRLDRRFAGAWRGYLGFSDSSETQGARTVNTRSLFAGLNWCLKPGRELFLEYERDQRSQGGYRRDGLSVGMRVHW